jgi:hypothetical protein
MGTQEDFGALLIAALEEAVAYKQGKLPNLRVDRLEVTERETTTTQTPATDRTESTGG